VSGVGAQASTSCSDELQAGQQVEVVGDGFAPGTPVTISVTSPGVAPASSGFQATVGTADADSTGSIDATVQVPFSATGYNEAPGDLAFLDATGTGASAPSNDDIATVSLVGPTSPCALAFPAASASVQLSVDDPALLGAAGAVFEASGPGLPGSVLGSPLADPPVPGSFAELTTDASGQSTCPSSEPAGVTCFAGALQGLYPGATYTLTELEAPPGYATSAPVSLSAPTDGSNTQVNVSNAVLVGNFTTGSGAQNCLLCLMAPNGGAVSTSGNASISWAGIATEASPSRSAITASGNASLSGTSLFGAGAEVLNGHAKAPSLAGGTVADPFSWYSAPVLTGTAQNLSVSGSQSLTASPGTYSSIIASSNAHINLSPGVYVLAGPLALSGNADVSGQGVTLELACPSYPGNCASAPGLKLSGNASLNLDGGAVGPGPGFVVLAASGTSGTISATGRAQLDLTGLVYGDGVRASLSGNAVAHLQPAVVVGNIDATGNAKVEVSEPPLAPAPGGGGSSVS